MTKEQEKKVQEKVLKEIIMTMRLNGVEYFTLPKPEQEAVMGVFQLGVTFTERYAEELVK